MRGAPPDRNPKQESVQMRNNRPYEPISRSLRLLPALSAFALAVVVALAGLYAESDPELLSNLPTVVAYGR